MKTGFAIVGFVVVALVVGTCVACVDDDDDENGFGWAEVAEYDYDRDGDDSSGNGSGDCAEARAQCSDSDFSPTFDKSPVDIRDNNVQVCLPFARCGGDESDEEPAPVAMQSPGCLISVPWHCDPPPAGA